MPPSRYGKRNDTYEPYEGVLSDAYGPVDLRGCSLRFLAKATVDNVEILIDSDSVAPLHGECINVEDEAGSTVAQRGRYRFEPASAAVSQAGLFNAECEVTFPNGKTLTWPDRQGNNPEFQLDPDIA